MGVENKKQEKEQENVVKNIKITDRGVKMPYSELLKSKDQWRMISFVLIFALIITSTNFIFGLMGYKSRVYVQSTEGALVELKELPKIPVNNTRMSNFLNEAIPSILALDFSNIDNKLTNARLYFDDQGYKDIISLLNRSNYIKNVQKNRMVINLTDSEHISKGKRVGRSGDTNIYSYDKSFQVLEYTGNRMEKKYIIVNATVKDSNDYTRYPWGLYISRILVNEYNENSIGVEAKRLLQED